ncbi:aldolase/citrate lyase family protein [Rhizobium sp.]|uniref:HpcH/HpaI aldolase family protein n=1 Tax=Rhizobium sp. TaxID=391 RepID=UPI002AA8DBEB
MCRLRCQTSLISCSYTRYPPEGIRGVAAVHRGSKFGPVPDYLKNANRDICTIIQLETPEAIERLPEMAAVDGIDALFVGTGDLSAAMGHIGNIVHPEVQALIEKAAKDAHAAGKPIGIVGPNPNMVKRLIGYGYGYGYDYAAISSDIAMMTGCAHDWLAQLKGEAKPATQPTAAY